MARDRLPPAGVMTLSPGPAGWWSRVRSQRMGCGPLCPLATREALTPLRPPTSSEGSRLLCLSSASTVGWPAAEVLRAAPGRGGRYVARVGECAGVRLLRTHPAQGPRRCSHRAALPQGPPTPHSTAHLKHPLRARARRPGPARCLGSGGLRGHGVWVAVRGMGAVRSEQGARPLPASPSPPLPPRCCLHRWAATAASSSSPASSNAANASADSTSAHLYE